MPQRWSGSHATRYFIQVRNSASIGTRYLRAAVCRQCTMHWSASIVAGQKCLANVPCCMSLQEMMKYKHVVLRIFPVSVLKWWSTSCVSTEMMKYKHAVLRTFPVSVLKWWSTSCVSTEMMKYKHVVLTTFPASVLKSWSTSWVSTEMMKYKHAVLRSFPASVLKSWSTSCVSTEMMKYELRQCWSDEVQE